MKKKMTFYTEAAYAVGMLVLAFGTALMERADFGMSMVVAPAYIIHLKVSEFLPFFSFGMAEYCFQAFLLAALILVLRKFKVKYLFSFVTAVLYGFALDLMIYLVALIPFEGTAARVVFYAAGMVLGSLGVAFLFNTYIAPEVYELFVAEISAKYKFTIGRTKTVYDCVSCVMAVVLSFCFFGFGRFEGVKLGTVICALVNGFLIGKFCDLFKALFSFKNAVSMH